MSVSSVSGGLVGRGDLGGSSASGDLKRCSKCHAVKPRGEFYRRRESRDGLHGQCKRCQDRAAVESKRRARIRRLGLWDAGRRRREMDGLLSRMYRRGDSSEVLLLRLLKWLHQADESAVSTELLQRVHGVVEAGAGAEVGVSGDGDGGSEAELGGAP